MREPHLTQFRQLIRAGAGTQDIHDSERPVGYGASGPAHERFIQREIDRVALHQRSLCPLVEKIGPVGSILDVGASTGGTTVALALSQVLRPRRVIGVDPNRLSLQAAGVRAAAYELNPPRIEFLPIVPGEPLPFPDGCFDLSVCVSVLEFISTAEMRGRLIDEILRVTRPGGHAFLATPNPIALHEYHTRRLFGDLRRRDGYPWSSSPWQLRRHLAGTEIIPIHDHYAERDLRRLGLGPRRLPGWMSKLVPWVAPWQKYLVRRAA